MQTIKSFEVDHTILTEGLYVSRKDGDVTTYDMRTRRPNGGDYMDNLTMHSVEHMLATYLRNGAWGEHVVYFGPMGCQTGFYLLTAGLENGEVLTMLRDALTKTVEHNGEIFGKSAEQCGQYLNLDLAAAKAECARYLRVLDAKPVEFTYLRKNGGNGK